MLNRFLNPKRFKGRTITGPVIIALSPIRSVVRVEDPSPQEVADETSPVDGSAMLEENLSPEQL